MGFFDAVNNLTLRCANNLLALPFRLRGLLLLVLGNLLALSFRLRSILLLALGSLLVLLIVAIIALTSPKVESEFEEGMIRVNTCHQGFNAMVEVGSCVWIVQDVWIAVGSDGT